MRMSTQHSWVVAVFGLAIRGQSPTESYLGRAVAALVK